MTAQLLPCDLESDILDWTALNNRCLLRSDLVDRILTRFRDSLAGELQQLEQAYQAHDAPAIASIAHRLKGTSLTVSANRLADSSQRLREVALSDFAGVEQLLAALRNEVLQVSELISRRLSGEVS